MADNSTVRGIMKRSVVTCNTNLGFQPNHMAVFRFKLE